MCSTCHFVKYCHTHFTSTPSTSLPSHLQHLSLILHTLDTHSTHTHTPLFHIKHTNTSTIDINSTIVTVSQSLALLLFFRHGHAVADIRNCRWVPTTSPTARRSCRLSPGSASTASPRYAIHSHPHHISVPHHPHSTSFSFHITRTQPHSFTLASHI